jgi:DNA-binding LacI/PurR family transcriptional regulator
VAAAAGVSPTTVSDALNGKGRLPDETRERVRQVAEKLGYRPNAIARGLRNQQVGLLGLILVPAPGTSVTSVSYWIEVLTQAAESALARGYALVMLPADPEALAPMAFPVDGVIVVDPMEGDAILDALHSEAIPAVTIGRDLSGSHEPWLDDDIKAGVGSLLTSIAQSGERVALLTMSSRKSYIQDALDGALAWKGHPKGCPIVVEVASPLFADVQPAVAQLIESGLPDVLLGVNERITLAALRALRAAGLSVPGDIRLASLVEDPELSRVKPAVTALVQHPKRSAELAVTTVIDLIEGRKTRKATLTPMDVRLRASAPRVGSASGSSSRARKSAR